MLRMQMRAAKRQKSQRCPNCKQSGIQMYALTFPNGPSWNNAVPQHIFDGRNLPQTHAVISPCAFSPFPPPPKRKKNSCIQAGRHHPPAVAQGPGRSPASGNSSCLTRLEQIQILDRLNISLNIGTLSFPSAFCL